MKKTIFTLLALILLLAACTPLAAQDNNVPAAGSSSDQAALATEAPASPAQAAPADTGGAVTRALTSEPTSLDPHGAATSGQNVILPYLFDTLVYRDSDNTYKPYLAESWEQTPDGKAITFKLRKDVKFTDGTAMNADAVVFTFERFKKLGAKNPVAGGVLAIDTIKALDPLTVRFTFKKPTTTFLGTLSMPYSGILSPTAVEKEGDSFGQKPVGSGPFVLSEWKPGVSITLARNPDYNWGPAAVKNQGPARIEKAVFKIIPDPGAQLAAFQTGDIDILFVNSPAQVAKLQKDPNAQMVDATLNSLIYLGFNCQKSPFDDVKVRQALSHAINKEELIKTALGGIGEPAFAPLAPTLPGFDPALKSYEQGFDQAQAKSLLASAGFTPGQDGILMKDGQPLTAKLVTSTRPPNAALATILQSQLKSVGVDVEIQQLESQAAIEAMTKGDYDLSLWRYDWNDADVLNIYLGGNRIGSTNRQFYKNDQVDALMTQADQTMDPAARSKLYVEAEQQILTDAPWQPLYIPKDIIVLRKSLQNVVIGSMGRVLYNDVTVGK